MTIKTTPSLDEMNEYAKKVAAINGWKMPDKSITTTRNTAGWIYFWRQIKLYWAQKFFGWSIDLTPSDTPEFMVMAEAAQKMVTACREHESYMQFKVRTCK